MVWDIVVSLIKGIGVGVVVSFIGYIKSLPDGEVLCWKKASPTLIIGFLAGAVATWQGIGLETATQLLATFGIVTLINQLWIYLMKEKENRCCAKIKKTK